MSPLHLLGPVLRALTGLGEWALLLARTCLRACYKWPSRRVILEQMVRIGPASLPVVLLTGLFTGAVLAVQSTQQFKRVEVGTLVGAIVTLSMVRELGPVLTGLMLAGRVGGPMAAELGTMKVTEQIDALHTLAADPISILVLPRFAACVLLMPLLTLLSDAVGLLGGYLVGVHYFGVPSHFYILHSREWFSAWDLATGLVKSAVFGALIASISCSVGLGTSGGAEGVGRATTSATVTSSVAVLVSDFFLAVLLQVQQVKL
ncbi:MAG: ABC transporter permease [Planctomycetes bacterium]|nr:ABC transporter permease [Planctomycetota bacterium]